MQTETRTYLRCRNPISRPDSRKKQIARNLANDITNSPARLHVIELVAIKSQVLFHPRYKSIVDVDLVEILDEIPYLKKAW